MFRTCQRRGCEADPIQLAADRVGDPSSQTTTRFGNGAFALTSPHGRPKLPCRSNRKGIAPAGAVGHPARQHRSKLDVGLIHQRLIARCEAVGSSVPARVGADTRAVLTLPRPVGAPSGRRCRPSRLESRGITAELSGLRVAQSDDPAGRARYDCFSSAGGMVRAIALATIQRSGGAGGAGGAGASLRFATKGLARSETARASAMATIHNSNARLAGVQPTIASAPRASAPIAAGEVAPGDHPPSQRLCKSAFLHACGSALQSASLRPAPVSRAPSTGQLQLRQPRARRVAQT